MVAAEIPQQAQRGTLADFRRGLVTFWALSIFGI